MKKNILISTFIFCFLVGIKAYGEGVQNFAHNFSLCNRSTYTYENKIYLILGWANRKCYYKEISAKKELICGFKTLELQEVAASLKNGSFNLYNGITSSSAGSKYALNPLVCTVKMK